MKPKKFFGILFIIAGLYFFWRWVTIPVLEPAGLMQCVWLGLVGFCALCAVSLLEPQRSSRQYHR